MAFGGAGDRPAGRLTWRGCEDLITEGIANHLGGFAGDPAELAHPVGAKREYHVCESSDVAEKSITVSLDEAAVAPKSLESHPFVLGGHSRAQLKVRRMVGWTIEGLLA